MNKKVNFEDNFFILIMRIRLIRDTITLDADPELFLKQIMDDIRFIDETLRVLLDYLEHSCRLFERDELLEQLEGAEKQFSGLLREFLSHEGNLSVGKIPAFAEKLEAVRLASLERRKTIEKCLPSGDDADAAMVVGSQELTELLKAL